MLCHIILDSWDNFFRQVVVQLKPLVEKHVQMLFDAVAPGLVTALLVVIRKAQRTQIHALDETEELD